MISITTLHNLFNYDLDLALQNKRVCKGKSYICVEGYRNEKKSQFNAGNSHAGILKPEEWKYIFKRNDDCDYEFIFFE